MSNAKRQPRSQPFSVRLRPAANLLVTEEARRTGRSRSAIVEELAEEGAKMRLFPGIGFRDRPRRAWVIGSGLDVWELIDLLRSYNGDVATLRKQHPLVTEQHVKITRAYAERFPDEIDAILAEQRRPLDELLELYPFLQVAETEG